MPPWHGKVSENALAHVLAAAGEAISPGATGEYFRLEFPEPGLIEGYRIVSHVRDNPGNTRELRSHGDEGVPPEGHRQYPSWPKPPSRSRNEPRHGWIATAAAACNVGAEDRDLKRSEVRSHLVRLVE